MPDLKKLLQKLRKYSQKGLLVTLLIDVKKKLFYDKSWLFPKESTWHRSHCAEMGGNGSKIVFFGQKMTFIVKMEWFCFTSLTLPSLASRLDSVVVSTLNSHPGDRGSIPLTSTLFYTFSLNFIPFIDNLAQNFQKTNSKTVRSISLF